MSWPHVSFPSFSTPSTAFVFNSIVSVLFHIASGSTLVTDIPLQKLMSAGFVVLSCYSLVYYPAFCFMDSQIILHSLYVHLFLLIFPSLLRILSNIHCVFEVPFSDILFSLVTFSVHMSSFLIYILFVMYELKKCDFISHPHNLLP